MTFSDARAKIKRADEHIANLETRLTDLPKSYISSIEIDPTARYKAIKHDMTDTELRVDIALLIGDAAHNLNCALDYSWIETITKLVPSAVGKHAKFPVYPTHDALEGTLCGRIVDATSERLYRFIIDEIKPYNGGNFAIWPVHVLDKRDKHRLLIPLLTFASIEGIKLEDQSGTIHTGGTWGTAQAPPYYVDFLYDLNIKDKGNLSLDITFDDTLIDYAPRVDGTLSIYSRFIVEVVKTLEAFVETV